VRQGDDGVKGSQFDNGTECLIVVDAGTLSETLKNPTGFVAVERAVSMKLVSENPFPNIGVSRTLNKIPSIVVMKRNTLLFHGLVPVWIG
jgi:hypothetical protein